jgi:hypothetical protein
MLRAQSDSTFTLAPRPTQCSNSVMVRRPERVFGSCGGVGLRSDAASFTPAAEAAPGTAVPDLAIEHEHEHEVWRGFANWRWARVPCVPSSSLAHCRYFSTEVSPTALGMPQPATHLLITQFRNVDAGEAMPSGPAHV